MVIISVNGFLDFLVVSGRFYVTTASRSIPLATKPFPNLLSTF
jgi:hypothetical protein